MPEAHDPIAAVEAAATAYAEAERALIRETGIALATGATVVDVAHAAGVTRQTIYRWRNREGDAVPRILDVAETLDAGLLALTVVLSPGAARHAAQALSADDIEVKGRRFEQAATNLPPSRAEIDPEMLDRITLASEVLSAARSARAATGAWPRRVPLN